jgi:hypothetical protein
MDELQRELKIAWAAGFFDGEGCVVFRNAKCQFIKWTQNAIEPLIQLDLMFNSGSLRRNENCHEYLIFGKEAIKVLRLMLPYLTVKREKALEAIRTDRFIRPKKPNRI